MRKKICPTCGHGKIRRSHRRNVLENCISLFDIKPFRCSRCDGRFFVQGASFSPSFLSGRKILIGVAVGVIGATLILIRPSLKNLERDSEPPGHTEVSVPRTLEKGPTTVAVADTSRDSEAPGGEAEENGAVLEPVPEQEGVTAPPPLKPDLAGVEPFIRSWCGAWQRQDVKAYLDHYSGEFVVPGDLPFAEWARIRQIHLLQPEFIEIELSGIAVESKGPALVEATFEQRYRSDRYADVVIKVLGLVWQGNGWRIAKETSRPK